MSDTVLICDYCGTPDPMPDGTGYRCLVCGEWWNPEAEEEEPEDA